ncbi:NAD-dependent epimerase/dehydratase family protein [Natronococcus occultus]|uniref:NAD-dependent epimerase/dehydratase family protein n=1 Tax=Natronococcus occultus TaxID=29288 RepID=UPI000677644B|nr:NAD(P)-dependent oxidoreductase [Natronococcus occultus]
MRVFVAGATGVFGRHLVRTLADGGHDVVGLARDEAGERRVARAGGTPHRGDVLDPASLHAGVDSVDAIVHAATRLPTGPRPTAADWRRNDRVRLDGARSLLAIADSVGIDRFAFPSVVWAYRHPDCGAVAVDGPPNPDRTTRSAVATERLLRRAAADGALEATILRYGWVYGPTSAQTRSFGRRLLGGRLPIVGGGSSAGRRRSSRRSMRQTPRGR